MAGRYGSMISRTNTLLIIFIARKPQQHCWIPRLVLDGSVELGLLGRGLESSVTELGGGIDEGELDLLQSNSLGVDQEGLAESDDSLLGSSDATLEHDPVVGDLSVVREASHGGDALLSEIELSGSGVLVTSGTNAVDLLVDLSAVVVSALTSTSHGEVDTARMPSTNTGDLAQTTVGLAGQAGGTPTGGDTLVSVTLSHSDGIDHLIGGEDIGDLDLLLEQALGEGDLLLHGTSVDLDLHDVGLLLTNLHLLHLSVGNHTHDGAVLDDSLQLGLHIVLTLLGSKAGGVVGEGLALAVVPVLVESALARVAQVLSEHRGEGAQTLGGLDVSHNTDDHHGRALEDGHSLHDLLLVGLAAGTVQSTDDVGHTSLVSHEGGQMRLNSHVVLRELSDVTTVVGASLAGEETEVSVTRA